MKKFAVIGSPIKHSLSPQIHTLFGKRLGIQISYEAIEVKRAEFKAKVDKLLNDGYLGLNVTLPLKEMAFQYSDINSEEATFTESVNTLNIKNSSVFGETTDGQGLLLDLKDKGFRLEGSRVVLLGSGGSAKSIIPSLLSNNLKSLSVANRTQNKAEVLVNKYKDTSPEIGLIEVDKPVDSEVDIVINATSAGTLKQSLTMPPNIFGPTTKVYDLSYSKDITPFNLLAQKAGIKDTYDGLGMLVNQAALSFEIWNEIRPDIEGIEGKLRS